MEHYKICELLSDSTVPKFVTENGLSKWFIKWSIFSQQKMWDLKLQC